MGNCKKIKAGNYAVLINGTPKRYFWTYEEAKRFAYNIKDQIFGFDDDEILDCNTGVIWKV